MLENTDTPTPEEVAKKQAKQADDLKLAYRAVFGSDKGKLVWADLRNRFCFDRWAAEDTEDFEKIGRRVFMQGPLHHIKKMMESPLSETKKRQRKEKIP